MGQRLAALLSRVEGALTYGRHPAGERSRRRLSELAGFASGERCFIIGNGPSLAQMNLAPLRDEWTFGLNRIYLLFGEIGFATSFLVSVNDHVVAQCADELLDVDATTFLSWRTRRHVGVDNDVIFLRSTGGPRFSRDPRDGVWEGATVTYVALQLAHWMGFQDVFLIGVDHSFSSEGKKHALVTSTEDDPDHFSPRYFGPGFRWQLPDLDTSEVAYRLARRQFEASGRRVWNASVGGRLEVFPRIEYSSVVNEADRWEP